MRIITETTETKVFLFDELPSDIQEVAIENYRAKEPHYNWNEHTDELFHQILEAAGFSEVESYFSGFWCQGDGASFKGEYSYEKGFIKKVKNIINHLDDNTKQQIMRQMNALLELQKRNGYKIIASVEQRGNYCHSGTMWVSAEKDVVDEDVNGLSRADENLLTEIFRSLADVYYNMLDTTYYWLISTEVAKQDIEEKKDELEFCADGTLYH